MGKMIPNLTSLLDADWQNLHEFAGQNAPKRKFKHNFSARFVPVFFVRLAQRLDANGWHRLAKLFSLINVVLFGLEVPARLDIGPGLVIPHPFGTIIGAGYIGANVVIYQQVTLGASMADFAYDPALRPTVEDGVKITAGAKILGPITLGAGCVIGANAVVLRDIPPGAVAVGVPAKIIIQDPISGAKTSE